MHVFAISPLVLYFKLENQRLLRIIVTYSKIHRRITDMYFEDLVSKKRLKVSWGEFGLDPLFFCFGVVLYLLSHFFTLHLEIFYGFSISMFANNGLLLSIPRL